MPPAPFIDVALLEQPVTPIDLEPFPAAAGAECVFLGRSRAVTHPGHGPLDRLDYEAHRALAERVLRDLAGAAVREHGALAVRLRHAIGPVPVGAASVLVQVACPHRGEAFAACRMLIDRLKAEAPIWKREVWRDGTTWSEGRPVAAPAP